jgi:hypothetical protein
VLDATAPRIFEAIRPTPPRVSVGFERFSPNARTLILHDRIDDKDREPANGS